jgi:hypothetical protein
VHFDGGYAGPCLAEAAAQRYIDIELNTAVALGNTAVASGNTAVASVNDAVNATVWGPADRCHPRY